MSGLVIHQSNHVESLAEALSNELSAYNRDPLLPVTIVVQSRGMERWLSIELAQRMGLIANARFPFPNTILSEIFTAVTPDAAQSNLFDSDSLTFRAIKTLQGCLDEEAFAPLQEYISRSDDDLRRFQLCQKIAGMYDQLATFRPEQIRAWDQGNFDSWHGSLWHRMLDDAERQTHRPALFHKFTAQIKAWHGPLTGIPEKLFIFGISTLPKLHLEVLAAIAEHIDVHMFLMNPCQEFWHDIASDKLQIKLVKKAKTTTNEHTKDLHFERGHPLLSSLGNLSQEFLNLIGDYSPDLKDLSQSPGKENLLAALQTQILELEDPAVTEKQQLDPSDQSIQVHSCHSSVREVEVLRDALLQQLNQDPSLEPRDILVMAPDIESYAPYIAAVFDGETTEKQKIPFSIADRSRQKESPVAEAFLKVLALRGARLTATQVLELLEEPTIRDRFSLSLDDLDLVRQWVKDTHICWGVDGAFKERFDLPPAENNTWEAGFDRLFLGFALPADEKALFEGILPYDGVEGSNTAVLGNFYGFCEQLFATLASFDQSRTLDGWGQLLSTLVENFFQTEAKNELFALTRQLQRLEQIENLSGYAEGVDFEVLRCILQRELSLATSSGFLRGGVTFCSLLPMRSIPFKVVALLGMNDAAFPRKSPSVSFDLMSEEPEKGDPSRRKEDRYLFLEAILSARKALIISYIGQSVKDNSEAPPSVVVCELLDALEQGFKTEGTDDIRKRLVTRHRLQGFNPAYFSAGQRLFSYSHDNYQGALALASQKSNASSGEPNDFMQGKLAISDEVQQTVTLAQLVKFIQNPTQYFLRNRLGVFIDKSSDALQDQEPFNLDGLSNYQISQELVEQILTDDVSPQQFDIYAAKGVLPQGNLSTPTFEKCLATAQAFTSKVQSFTQGKPAESQPYDQNFDGMRLVGELSGLYPQGLLRHRCASIKPKDRLSTWIHHLAFCSVANESSVDTTRSHLLGNSTGDRTYSFVAHSQQLLTDLLKVFQAGQLRPLPFFPKAAFGYSEENSKGKNKEKCLDKARTEWLGSDRSMGECEDVDFDYCFGRLDPINEEFTQFALQIVKPLLNNESKA